MPSRWKLLTHEMKHHAPYTLGGAIIGVILLDLSVSQAWVGDNSQEFFEIFHPLHVLFSAITTTALYRLYAPKRVLLAIVIGVIGSIGIGTLSDSLIPFWGELMLGLEHSHDAHGHCDHGAHIGIKEHPLIILSAAALGVGIGFFWPRTKLNHAVHVFLSTAASLFHVRMNTDVGLSIPQYGVVTAFLFIAVWFPCCASDIFAPLLLAPADARKCGCCGTTLKKEEEAEASEEETT
jgi:hypothetical protein